MRAQLQTSGFRRADEICKRSACAHECALGVIRNVKRTKSLCVFFCIVAICGCHRESGGSPGTSREFGYVANAINPGRLSEFTIDPRTGAWTQIPGSPFVEGADEPNSIAAAPSGKFLYVLNRGEEDVSVLSIDSATGSLTAVGAAVRVPINPQSLAMHPAGTFLYATNDLQPGTVSALRIDGANGTLSLVPGSPFETGAGVPDSVAVTPSGKFVYVTSGPPSIVSGYSVNAATGALTPIAGSPFAAGMGARNLSVSPAGKFLYVSDSYGGTILAYSINETSGALATVAGSPFPAGSHPAALALDPRGNFLYAINETTLGTISAFKVDQNNGALAGVPGSPFSTVHAASAITIDPMGKFLVATVKLEDDGKLESFKIDSATGALKQIDGSPFGAGSDPAAVIIVQSKWDASR
jgi:6-phosphogluconolactonase (cycloisomerase 2 family)